MDTEYLFKRMSISDSPEELNYNYVDVFVNANKLAINYVYLERTFFELKKDIPKDLDSLTVCNEKLYEKKTEVIPALDKKWLPKNIFFKFEPYIFTLSKEENQSFITNNIHFKQSLQFLLNCSFHQFWCTILFDASAALALRSFLLNPIPSYQSVYLEDDFANIYKSVFNLYVLVYERLITFRKSEIEYMTEEYGIKILLDKKLINLPMVNMLAFLYKNSNLQFVNRLTNVYFNDTSQLDFQIKEVEDIINQTVIVLEMIGGYICGFDKDAVIVPISVTERPAIFSLLWVYSIVNYLLNTVSLLHTLLQFYKPAIEMCLGKDLPYRLPFMYVNIYRELYEMLDNREELKVNKDLSDKVFDEINLGRSEIVDVYHMFISYCLDKTLEYIGHDRQQEHMVETYLRLLNTALEDEYFMCDYNMRHNVALQNETFEMCTNLDDTRTQFIISCINKLPRHKRLQKLSNIKKQTIEDVFKEFKPPEIEQKVTPTTNIEQNICDKPDEDDIEVKINNIMDMFPHLGDGFILQCLQSYNYNCDDVINAILEENLSPDLYNIAFDSIRIPPEPEPEKPVLAYKGKKPDYDDALKLLNDKSDLKELKTYVLEGVQYSNDYLYDDEYDDRYDDDVPIKVPDNPLEQEILTFNLNHEDLASDTSYSSEDEYDDDGKPIIKTEVNGKASGSQNNKSKMNFCEDPALIRERREARYKSKQSFKNHTIQKKADVVGKAKGQGQEKKVIQARDKKNVQKSSKANHSRKKGAQWKRNTGMIPS